MQVAGVLMPKEQLAIANWPDYRWKSGITATDAKAGKALD